MRLPRIVYDHLHLQTRGILPVPALIIITYCFLCWVINIAFFCMMPLHHAHEFWTQPHAAGLSKLDLYRVINVLFAFYLFFSLCAFIYRKRRFRLAIFHWGAYGFSFVLLIMLHVYVARAAEVFEIPDEASNLKTAEFYEIANFYPAVPPRTALGRGYEKPLQERFIVVIDRVGRLIINGRTIGAVGEAIDELRSQLAEWTGKLKRDSDGASNLTLLIHADRLTPFESVYEIMQLCKESAIGIYMVEFGCQCFLIHSIPDAEKERMHTYWLPSGKIDAYLPRDEQRSPEAGEPGESIEIFIINDKSATGFRVSIAGRAVNGDRGEDTILNTCYRILAQHHRQSPESKAIIRVDDRVRHGDVISIYAECLRAGIPGGIFECGPLSE